jgi:hypothetical protein
LHHPIECTPEYFFVLCKIFTTLLFSSLLSLHFWFFRVSL